LNNLYYFKEKDCPFCDGGQGSDDRSNLRDKCNHAFTVIEHNAILCAIDDMKREIKKNLQIAKKMRKIMDAKK